LSGLQAEVAAECLEVVDVYLLLLASGNGKGIQLAGLSMQTNGGAQNSSWAPVSEQTSN
jgi:hypothetical protein